MPKSTPGAISGRPNRALVVKCGYEGSTRKVNFPSAATCRLDSLRRRVEECFSLSASPFSLTYTDDDGEEFSIRSENDLTEAIAYFVSGDDSASIRSGVSRSFKAVTFSSQKVILRLDVVVEYDGPSLSDTSSISSFSTGEGTQYDDESTRSGTDYSWRSSRHDYSHSVNGSHQTFDQDPDETATAHGVGSSARRANSALSSVDPVTNLRSSASHLTLNSHRDTNESGSSTNDHRSNLTTPARHLDAPAGTHRPRHSLVGTDRSDRPLSVAQGSPSTTQTTQRPILTGPESAPAPVLLTHSELGHRWLAEQSHLANSRWIGRINASAPSARSSRSARDDEEGDESDEESQDDFALVKDAKGKYYYSYQSADTISLGTSSGFADSPTGPEAGPSRRSLHPIHTTSSSLALQEVANGRTSANESPSSPIFAPDCSACKIRLDYMRYVCVTCGEAETWKDGDPEKEVFARSRHSSDTSTSDGSEETEWAGGANHGEPSRGRSTSLTTEVSARPDHVSPTSSSLTVNDNIGGKRRSTGSTGFELCVNCIEAHGVEHTRQATQVDARSARRTSERGQSSHTFREKIWSVEGWIDVDYSDDSDCSICRTALYSSRYKCVSCSKFDLCKGCYRKVEEIHPTHAFLTLPDRPLPVSAASLDEVGSHGERLALRHPGIFCHNCLQDIVGPRFHCAVCPSWDLCINCESIAPNDSVSGHTSDHIMMKLPVPLPVSQVNAVSRRARDRWITQDSSTVTAVSPIETEFRSPSPTNETVYAGGTRRRPEVPQVSLDHGCLCDGCGVEIIGKRYQCANCPSLPKAYSLCSSCEPRSYRLHDPKHSFFKLDRPVHFPLNSPSPFLPLLYRGQVGEVPSNTFVDSRDPKAYLAHLLHRETLCDIHSDQIRGVWLRCAHCADGFDICEEAEEVAHHDPTHVFIAFKARVDMLAFRTLADLGAEQSKPLLTQRVYLDS